MVLSAFPGLLGCSSDPSKWSEKKVDKWFDKGEWLNGWNIKPDASVNRRELALSWYHHRDRWEKAFNFLKSNNLSKLELKRYDIDGDNVYAPVSEYLTKDEATARFEAHRKYIDIQYVVIGREKMSVAPLSSKGAVLEPYDDARDIEFLSVDHSSSYIATPEKFFIFFPSDIHRPGVMTDSSSMVRKIVVKVKAD